MPAPDSDPHPEDETLGAIVARTGPYPPRGVFSRRTRLKVVHPGSATCFHVMSRTCGGDVFWDDVEKEAMRRLMMRMASFLGIELLTYCIMGNHFHALVRVPDRATWTEQFEGEGGEQRLLRHLGTFYSKAFMQRLRYQLSELRRMNNESRAQQILTEFRRRFCDVSGFMMELKVRFSRWFNKRHERKGTLWMGRFRSVLVQGDDHPLRTMAAYIDLNAVRAGLVKKPEDYRWCGYADALAGQKPAQEGICVIMERKHAEWANADGEEHYGVRAGYRRLLYHYARLQVNKAGKVVRKGITAAEADQVIRRERGRIPTATLAMQSVRHFSRGLAIGTKDFVEQAFNANRGHFSPQRKTGARKVDSDGTLHALRQM